MGSISGTAKIAVDNMRESGLSVGLLKVRLLRPFPSKNYAGNCRAGSASLSWTVTFLPGVAESCTRKPKQPLRNEKCLRFGYLAGLAESTFLQRSKIWSGQLKGRRMSRKINLGVMNDMTKVKITKS